LSKESIGLIVGESITMVLLFFCWKGLSWNGLLIPLGIVVILMLFTIYFFRDPNRTIPYDENVILSPADGKIIEIADLRSTEAVPFFSGPMKKVVIFLSVWDVHINRLPIAGKVILLKHQTGRFWPAYKNEAGTQNEQMIIGLDSPKGKVLVKQIAGILARRIVCRLHESDLVRQGERFGMIKFGSRAELYFPSSVNVKVKIGDRVRAGQTIIGEYLHAK
jgi:phosphatidylserine decarboxylase